MGKTRDKTPLTIGLDVGGRHTQACGLDHSATVVLAQRLSTQESALRRWASKLPRAVIALEVGRESPWLSRLLTECGHEVIVANPRKVRLITRTDTKNDRLDAEKLARIARLDRSLLFPVQHRREDTQAALAIVRSREVAVEARTKLINSVRAQVRSFGASLPPGHISTFASLLPEVPEPLQAAVTPLMTLIADLNTQVHAYDRLVKELADEVYPETAAVQQIWGVGPLTALTFVLVIEEPDRFAHSRDVGAYLGLKPRQHQSGGLQRQLPITKAGDRLLRRLLVHCARRLLSAGGPDTDLRRWGLTLAARGGAAARRRAHVAVARKLAVLMHRLWVTGETYQPLRSPAITPTTPS